MSYFKELGNEDGIIKLHSVKNGLDYRIAGFQSRRQERLRVNLKISLETSYFIDTLDLYLSKSRMSMIKDAAKKLKISADDIENDIDELLLYLEAKQNSSLEINEQKVLITEVEKKEALKALKSKTLIDDILADFEACGYVGEENAKLTAFLATISRLLPKPLGLLIVSASGAGKSTLQEAVSLFVPEEDLLHYTRITGQSLFYNDENALKHKVLSISEESGMQEAIYSIRNLQSDQKLSVSVTRSDPQSGQLSTEEHHVNGPVVIMLSTTKAEALDYETRNRFVIVSIDESEAQTARILKEQRSADSLEGLFKEVSKDTIIKKERNMQRLLESLAVHNPFHEKLSFATTKLQMRREQKKYLSLIKSIALLRQYQKEKKEKNGIKYIDVDLEDISLANKLARAVLGRSLDDLAPHSRALLNEIHSLWKISEVDLIDYQFSMKDLLEKLSWSHWQLRQNLKQLIDQEYIQILKGGSQGKQTVYALNYDADSVGNGYYLEGLIDLDKKLKAC